MDIGFSETLGELNVRIGTGLHKRIVKQASMPPISNCTKTAGSRAARRVRSARQATVFAGAHLPEMPRMRLVSPR